MIHYPSSTLAKSRHSTPIVPADMKGSRRPEFKVGRNAPLATNANAQDCIRLLLRSIFLITACDEGVIGP